MRASELRAKVIEAGQEPYFFSRKTMQAFGDTMANYGVRSASITVEYDAQGNYLGAGNSQTVEVWELYRKRAVSGNQKGSAYFDKVVFSQRFPMREA